MKTLIFVLGFLASSTSYAQDMEDSIRVYPCFVYRGSIFMLMSMPGGNRGLILVDKERGGYAVQSTRQIAFYNTKDTTVCEYNKGSFVLFNDWLFIARGLDKFRNYKGGR